MQNLKQTLQIMQILQKTLLLMMMMMMMRSSHWRRGRTSKGPRKEARAAEQAGTAQETVVGLVEAAAAEEPMQVNDVYGGGAWRLLRCRPLDMVYASADEDTLAWWLESGDQYFTWYGADYRAKWDSARVLCAEVSIVLE
eukprot:3272998-Amphidinium_carterae.1